MIQAKNSWLCVNCGHIEAVSPASVPLVSKKASPAKAISQDLSPPTPKPKLDEPKAGLQTVPDADNKSDVKAESAEILQSKPDPKPEESLASPVIQDNKAESKSIDIPTPKNEPEAKPNIGTPASEAPSSAELHPLQPVIVPSPTDTPSVKNDAVLPELPDKDTSKSVPISQTPAPTVEPKLDEATTASTATQDSSQSPDVEVTESIVVQPSDPKPETNVAIEPVTDPVKSEHNQGDETDCSDDNPDDKPDIDGFGMSFWRNSLECP